MGDKVKREYDYKARRVLLTFPQPLNKEGTTQIMMDLALFTPEIVDKAALLGIVTKVTKAKDPLETAVSIGKGFWPERSISAKVPIAVKGVARLTGRPLEECFHRWKNEWSKEQKAAINKDDRVKALVEQIRKEDEAAKNGGVTPPPATTVDTNTLFPS